MAQNSCAGAFSGTKCGHMVMKFGVQVECICLYLLKKFGSNLCARSGAMAQNVFRASAHFRRQFSLTSPNSNAIELQRQHDMGTWSSARPRTSSPNSNAIELKRQHDVGTWSSARPRTSSPTPNAIELNQQRSCARRSRPPPGLGAGQCRRLVLHAI
jgi:hypothetical protein